MAALSLTGKEYSLRALEPEDLDFLYLIENDEQLWEVSHSQTPYSRFLLRQYLHNSHQDIYEAKQLRLAICRFGSTKAIGLIDLYDFEPQHHRAGIGIVVSSEDRMAGAGSAALDLMIGYCFSKLNLHQLFACVETDNEASKALFAKFGFEQTGIKRDWNCHGGIYKDEAVLQLIKQQH